MARRYEHISRRKKEILKLRAEGFTYRQIGEELGFSHEQVKNFFERYYRKQRLKPDDDEMSDVYLIYADETDVQKLKAAIAMKDLEIKSLETENKLMKDLLSFLDNK